MAYENEVERILAESANHRQFLAQYRRLAQKREAVRMDTPRDKFCPGCSAELTYRVVEWANETLVLCVNCGFWTKYPFLIQEGKSITERWRPQRRTPTVVFRADGSMKEIRDL